VRKLKVVIGLIFLTGFSVHAAPDSTAKAQLSFQAFLESMSRSDSPRLVCDSKRQALSILTKESFNPNYVEVQRMRTRNAILVEKIFGSPSQIVTPDKVKIYELEDVGNPISEINVVRYYEFTLSADLKFVTKMDVYVKRHTLSGAPFIHLDDSCH
jgi:hypothetical protein